MYQHPSEYTATHCKQLNLHWTQEPNQNYSQNLFFMSIGLSTVKPKERASPLGFQRLIWRHQKIKLYLPIADYSTQVRFYFVYKLADNLLLVMSVINKNKLDTLPQSKKVVPCSFKPVSILARKQRMQTKMFLGSLFSRNTSRGDPTLNRKLSCL